MCVCARVYVHMCVGNDNKQRNIEYALENVHGRGLTRVWEELEGGKSERKVMESYFRIKKRFLYSNTCNQCRGVHYTYWQVYQLC